MVIHPFSCNRHAQNDVIQGQTSLLPFETFQELQLNYKLLIFIVQIFSKKLIQLRAVLEKKSFFFVKNVSGAP